LEALRNLNSIKRGVADMELDHDKIIKTIEDSLKSKFEGVNNLELSLITYCILFLI